MGKTRGKIRNIGRKMTRRRSKQGGGDDEDALELALWESRQEMVTKQDKPEKSELKLKLEEIARIRKRALAAQKEGDIDEVLRLVGIIENMENMSMVDSKADELKDYILVEVPGDGNCGFYALLGGLGMHKPELKIGAPTSMPDAFAQANKARVAMDVAIARVENGDMTQSAFDDVEATREAMFNAEKEEQTSWNKWASSQETVNCETLRYLVKDGTDKAPGKRKVVEDGLDIFQLDDIANKYRVCFQVYGVSRGLGGDPDRVGWLKNDVVPDGEGIVSDGYSQCSSGVPMIYLYNPRGVHFELLIPNNEWKPDNIERLKTTFENLGLNWRTGKGKLGRDGGQATRKSQGGRRRTRKNKRKVRRRGKKTKKR